MFGVHLYFCYLINPNYCAVETFVRISSWRPIRPCLSLQQGYNGTQKVKEKATAQEEDDGQPGHPVHLSVLQPREVLRCQDVSDSV